VFRIRAHVLLRWLDPAAHPRRRAGGTLRQTTEPTRPQRDLFTALDIHPPKNIIEVTTGSGSASTDETWTSWSPRRLRGCRLTSITGLRLAGSIDRVIRVRPHQRTWNHAVSPAETLSAFPDLLDERMRGEPFSSSCHHNRLMSRLFV
jgi:hypothetical protein